MIAGVGLDCGVLSVEELNELLVRTPCLCSWQYVGGRKKILIQFLQKKNVSILILLSISVVVYLSPNYYFESESLSRSRAVSLSLSYTHTHNKC
jgi:hypothetical protein